MYNVLVTPLEQVGKFSNIFSIMRKEGCKIIRSPYPHPVSEKDLLRIIQEVDAVITGSDEFTAKVIQNADRLKIISKYGVGVEKIDVRAATKKNIAVTYTPNQGAVAELTVGLILCLARRICEANTSVKKGMWKRSFIGSSLEGKILGVIGAGKVGRAVIKKARGFNMKVLVYDVYKDKGAAEKLKFEYTSLDKLLKEADFVTLHVPLNDNTKGLIGEKQIGLMKSSAYLINTARGGIVDEKALYIALQEERVAGAAIDTYVQEPPSKDNPLLRLDKVITTPHIGADSKETLRNMDLITAENILKLLKGESPPYVLNLPFT